jgi:subtilisin family serine protease
MLDGAGWGVDVYVLDTGVRIEHELLNIHDTKAKRYKYKYVWEGEGDSWKEEGHGTAVAGLIKEVAPYCNIIDVKTIGLGGNSRTLAHAIYDITEDHIRLRDREPKLKDWYGSVINLSLAAGDVGALRHAVADAIKAGIPVVAAAGNKNHANCQYPG